MVIGDYSTFNRFDRPDANVSANFDELVDVRLGCQRACNAVQMGVRTEPWTGLGCISEVRAVLHGTA